MKPDWKDAPQWANYLAQDKDGTWYWYENEPDCIQDNDVWVKKKGRMIMAQLSFNSSWRLTLEGRPNE